MSWNKIDLYKFSIIIANQQQQKTQPTICRSLRQYNKLPQNHPPTLNHILF